MPSASTSTTPADLLDPTSQAYKKAKRLYFKSTKSRDPEINSEWTPFRAAEKHYKARFPPPDLRGVLDLALLDETRRDEVKLGVWAGQPDAVKCLELPINSPGSSKAYAIPDIPGLVLLPGFLSHHEQRDIIRWSLSEHAKPPNETNLDVHYVLPTNGLWNSYVESLVNPDEDRIILPRVAADPETARALPVEASGPRKLVNNDPADPSNFHTLHHAPKPATAPSATVPPLPASKLMHKLRWANIGWYYHWGTKQYDFTKQRTHVDQRLHGMCRRIVDCVDWNTVFERSNLDWGNEQDAWKSWHSTYAPDAGIVNFYQLKDTLMGHADRSEVCATSPLVSISLGNSAIFLIGGLTRDTEPIPILLRSGDVVIMSGPECRRAYHGVPRILENTLPSHLQDDHPDWRPYCEYMKTTRINVNVRQVFPKDFVPQILK